MSGLYRMAVSPTEALNMSENPHFIIGYLIKDEWKDLKSKFHD